MTPKNAERALYSDILNLSVARREYNQLECLLQKMVPTFRVMDLLKDVLRSDEIKEKIIKKACYNEGQPKLIGQLLELNETQLAKQLVQGVPLERNTLSGYLSDEHYSLRPLHNFFFTRDASVALGDRVLIAKMARQHCINNLGNFLCGFSIFINTNIASMSKIDISFMEHNDIQKGHRGQKSALRAGTC